LRLACSDPLRLRAEHDEGNAPLAVIGGLTGYGARVGQLSFFSADMVPPTVGDLGGLLAAHGQITAGRDGARLSIVLQEPERAAALVAECAARGITAEVADARVPLASEAARVLFRTERTTALDTLAVEWTAGAVKSVPTGLTVSAGVLRLWVIAAGHADQTGYLLGLDPHHPELTDRLIAACSRAGLAGSFIGGSGAHPAIRVVGHRRLARLIDTVGTLPPGLPESCYPVEPVPVRTA
jgi:hypothetical protein